MKELNYENYKKEIDTLYDYLDLDVESVQTDIDNDYLTINKGKDGQDYLYYLDESKDVALNIATGKIITDLEELERIFY
ncbi:MAG TPA: hypothetical protein PLC25_05025 [Bacilli bacterium]|nr:hypothetical protein [Bacilli bacterium]